MHYSHGFLVALALAFVGCGHAGGNRALLDKAAHDLQCPRESITVLEGGKERDVEGCGRRATYGWTGKSWVPADQQPTKYGQAGPTIVYPGGGAPQPMLQTQYVQQPGTPYVQQPAPGQQPGTPYVQQPGPYGQPPAAPYGQTVQYVQPSGTPYVQQPPPANGQAPSGYGPPLQYQQPQTVHP